MEEPRPGQYRCTMQGVIQIWKDVKQKLKDPHWKLLMQTPFKHLWMAIHEERLDTTRKKDKVLDDILLAYDRDTEAFIFGTKYYKPSRMDVKLVFGLEDGPQDMGNITEHSKFASEIGPRLFTTTGSLAISTVKKKLGEVVLKEDDKSVQDTVKLMCLLLMQILMFPSTSAFITWSYFYYVDCLVRMKGYDWSGQILKYLFEGLNVWWDRPTKVKACTIFLMYWFSEHSTTAIEAWSSSHLGNAAGVGDGRQYELSKWIPRVVKWKLNELERIATPKQLYRLNTSDFNAGELLPTEEEKQLIESLDVELCDAEFLAIVNELEATAKLTTNKGKEACVEYDKTQGTDWGGPSFSLNLTQDFVESQQQDIPVINKTKKSMATHEIQLTQRMAVGIQGANMAKWDRKTSTQRISNNSTLVYKEPVAKWIHGVEKLDKTANTLQNSDDRLENINTQHIQLTRQMPVERERPQLPLQIPKQATQGLGNMTTILFKQPVPKWTYSVDNFAKKGETVEVNDFKHQLITLKRDKALLLMQLKALQRERLEAKEAADEYVSETTELMDEMENMRKTRAELERKLSSAMARIKELESNEEKLQDYARSLEAKVQKAESECQTNNMSKAEESGVMDFKKALEVSYEERLSNMEKHRADIDDKLEKLASIRALLIGKVEDEAKSMRRSDTTEIGMMDDKITHSGGSTSKSSMVVEENAGHIADAKPNTEHSCFSGIVRRPRSRKTLRPRNYEYPLDSKMVKKQKLKLKK